MNRKLIAGLLLACSFVFCAAPICSAESQYGVLKVIAGQETDKIYVDGNFEGTGTVSRDKIIIGNHLVQVKDENKNVLFEEMVSVREGEQTTVVAKTGAGTQKVEEAPAAPSEQPKQAPAATAKSPIIFGVEGSYGDWTVYVGGASGKFVEPVKEAGLYVKNSLSSNSYLKTSAHYIFQVSGASTNLGSFLGLDIGGTTDLIDTSIGLNYLFSNVSGATGSLGYQAFVGLMISNVTIGAKYLVLNGSVNSSGTNYSFSLSQALLGVSIDFGR